MKSNNLSNSANSLVSTLSLSLRSTTSSPTVKLPVRQSLWLFDTGSEGFSEYDVPLATQLDTDLKRWKSHPNSAHSCSSFSYNGYHYDVDFESMVQTNTKTGKERAVVRLLLTDNYALLDRDSAVVFRSMSYAKISSWIENHSNRRVNRSLNRGALMAQAADIFHRSTEFPVLKLRNGSTFPIQSKKGKRIVGGAKPTTISFQPKHVNALHQHQGSPGSGTFASSPIPTMPKMVARLLCERNEDDLVPRIIRIVDLQDQCQGLRVQFDVFRKSMPLGAQTKLVFHGTSLDAANKIIKYGFDFRYNKRHVYGKGNYFSVGAKYALGMAPKDSSRQQVVLVASIVFASCVQGNSSMVIPPDGKDTLVDAMDDPKVFVTYKDAQSVPCAMIVFGN